MAGQPVTLHLAVVPRVAGSNLTMSIKREPGINAIASELTAQKASASATYRQELSVTKLAGGPSGLQVLVTMELPEGSAHSWFNIPSRARQRPASSCPSGSSDAAMLHRATLRIASISSSKSPDLST